MMGFTRAVTIGKVASEQTSEKREESLTAAAALPIIYRYLSEGGSTNQGKADVSLFDRSLVGGHHTSASQQHRGGCKRKRGTSFDSTEMIDSSNDDGVWCLMPEYTLGRRF